MDAEAGDEGGDRLDRGEQRHIVQNPQQATSQAAHVTWQQFSFNNIMLNYTYHVQVYFLSLTVILPVSLYAAAEFKIQLSELSIYQ